MSCPCATVLAASTAIAAAIANAARHQVLVKGGLYLEHMAGIKCFCFDKTGTITTEVPRVLEVVPRTPWQDIASITALASSAELQSDHPMARALIREAKKQGIQLERDKETKTEVFLGRGIRHTSVSDVILVGNHEFMASNGVNVTYFKTKANQHMTSGHSVLFVAKNRKAQGMIAVANTIRFGAGSMLKILRQDGVAHFCLISGDTEPIVRTLAGQLGFDDFRAALMPEEKGAYVEKLLDEEGRGPDGRRWGQ